MPDDLASDTSATATIDYDAAADRIGNMLGEDILPATSRSEPTKTEPPTS